MQIRIALMNLSHGHQPGLRADMVLIVRYTRNWVHYGLISFIVLCSLIAALQGAVTR